MKREVAASILTANFLELKKDLNKLLESNVKWIHYDVMDYNFVPNLSFGTKLLKDITDNYDFNIDIHFMVRLDDKWSVESYLNSFYSDKLKQITFHIESLTQKNINDIRNYCKDHSIEFSLAINPNTEVDILCEYLPQLDNVLIMSVQPGFGGQTFIENTLEKVKKLVNIRNKNNYKFRLQIDGGINELTCIKAKNAGVDFFVAGSFLVNDKLSILELKERVELIEN
ncbi:ribulose-phosphate 3-epimerase [Spiroplasma turonicum]|uniref:Ribulose-phosphate 3-epimerase n=1 Tax=Spiroplasma turonicum TaxID=216946 RepID=A0A0K1P5H5_9MOLU|nr:ribulose-phosphate 3-epimerase [Spiroplasma turonicum]AKU79429.1 ribulose-phosphate 3-epimerase [Spiroplasma turonicum]ALX70450.1 ribulose-phosphate 3-epimerase [Spiroplasma turonicum]